MQSQELKDKTSLLLQYNNTVCSLTREYKAIQHSMQRKRLAVSGSRYLQGQQVGELRTTLSFGYPKVLWIPYHTPFHPPSSSGDWHHVSMPIPQCCVGWTGKASFNLQGASRSGYK
jgi:hypothetical protein